MKIAVIGAGIFGVTISLILSKNHNIDLYEKNNKILSETSAKNQMRFHYGFHYPRSSETIESCKAASKSFIQYYGNKYFGKTKNYYSLPKNKNKLNKDKYLKVINKHKLKYKIVKNLPNTELTILTNERTLNVFKFRQSLEKKIRNSNVNLFLNKKFIDPLQKDYDFVIYCIYSDTPNFENKFEYQLVEKTIIKLPSSFKNKSYVFVDGKFFNIDPYLGTSNHLISSVIFSKLKISNQKQKITKRKSVFAKVIKSSERFLPILKKAKYVNHFYTHRIIKKSSKKNDSRLTEIIRDKKNKKIYIFSGKWNSVIETANEIKKIL